MSMAGTIVALRMERPRGIGMARNSDYARQFCQTRSRSTSWYLSIK